MQDMALHTSSVWYTLVNCSIPRFSLAFQCRAVRNTQASVQHQSERGKRNLKNTYIAEYGLKSLTKRHSYTNFGYLICVCCSWWASSSVTQQYLFQSRTPAWGALTFISFFSEANEFQCVETICEKCGDSTNWATYTEQILLLAKQAITLEATF